MAYAYSELLAQARQWVQRAQTEGRLTTEALQALMSLDDDKGAPLFKAAVEAEARPLIVAFMGGTGVGKSSLLNRLAGQAIARAGIERPTSREVTLYHHDSLAPRTLPASLPLDSINISRHHNDDQRGVVWIDMPDFDSVEIGNKHLVLEWLPYIDALIYVVSPERYRDGKAWQLLLAEGCKHAWLFVMNQWDRGQPEQYDDFIRQLALAGFDQPLVFRTSCSEPVGDEFAELLDRIQQLSGRHVVEQLEQRGDQWRRLQLIQVLRGIENDCSAYDYSAARRYLEEAWPIAEAEWMQGLAWPLQRQARIWAENLDADREWTLWDDWARNRLGDLLDELALCASQSGIPCKPLKAALHIIGDRARQGVDRQCELAGRQALANPGNAAQRFFVKFTAVCETLLPLAAMSVVGFQVFNGYYHSASDATAYLGADFAIHSLLLIGLSWLLPFFLHRKIQPSLEKAVYKGLHKAIRQALEQVRAEVLQVVCDDQARNQALREEVASLIAQCGESRPVGAERQGLLGRVLPAT